MENDNWKKENTDLCKICGQCKLRMRSWTTANYENPLRKFLNWLIDDLGRNRAGRTFAISHYGGFVIIIYFSIIIIQAL